MKTKFIIALGFFALFGLMNQPFMPVPVRITTYSLAYLPSILASGLTYWYYDSTMEAKYTVLTTAAKSVVAWHAILSTTYYGQLAAASFWLSELEEYWNNHSNQTCVEMLSVSVAPTFAVSCVEFQVLRVVFLLYPYKVLNLNHDQLAYPLVASVPTVSGILLLKTYFESGGLCIEKLLDQTFNKLDMVINQENFLFSNMNLKVFFTIIFLIVEAPIHLTKYCKVITETIIYAACWWNRGRNAVHPATVHLATDHPATHHPATDHSATDHPATDHPATVHPASDHPTTDHPATVNTATDHPATDQPAQQPLQLDTYVNLYKVGPFLLVAICFGFIEILRLMNYKTEIMRRTSFDWVLLGLPIYWIISSDDICDFIQLKCSQLKSRLGYY